MRLFKIHPSQCGKIMSNGKGGNLSATCTSYLKEWYANDKEQIHSKYIDKGNWVEADLIDFMAEQLGFGLARKNMDTFSNDYMVGTPDVILPEYIVDVKAAWNRKTLLDAAQELNTDYEWQVRCYMELCGKKNGIIFTGLLDTPADVNFGNEINYDLEPNERWIAYSIKANPILISNIFVKVEQCREWLDAYDKSIKLGTIKTID